MKHHGSQSTLRQKQRKYRYVQHESWHIRICFLDVNVNWPHWWLSLAVD
jgi:hypothetical protein